MLVLAHPDSGAITTLLYNPDTGHVEVNVGHHSEVQSVRSSIALAQFLREVGMPFRAVRDAARIERGLWNPEPEPQPEPTAA